MANVAILKINGTTIKAPSTIKVTLQDIDSDDTGRNQKGTMIRDRVVGGADAKRKVECTWKGLSSSEVSTLLRAMGGVSFQLTYPDPYTGGNRVMKAYVGDRSVPIYVMRPNGSYVWESLSANFVEY